jgi:flavin-dependent dehydrogenase
MSASFDMAVVGGGPAGSILALRMAQLGASVCLLERARFPRRHLGESLTPGVLPLLASIGASAEVTVGAMRVERVGMRWEADLVERRDPDARGLLVDRGVFDAVLLGHARAAGVEVRQPATVRAIASRGERGFTLAVDAMGGPVLIDARLVADASGRSAGLGARALGRKRTLVGARTFAVHAYWRGRALPATPSIEAVPRGWCWGVPIPDGSYETLAFIDESRWTERDGSLERWLVTLLGDTSIGRAIEGARLDGPARIVDASASLDEHPIGARWIRVGDAALTLDPLSSSGVQKAIQSALAAAIVLHTLLRHPGDRALAIRFYEEHVRAASARHARWAAEHYAVARERFDDPFWARRAASGDEVAPRAARPSAVQAARGSADASHWRLSAEARVREVPCLGVDRVELRQALEHPALDGPAAFLGDTALAPLVTVLPPRFRLEDLGRCWPSLAPSRALAIARYLRDRGVLEPA